MVLKQIDALMEDEDYVMLHDILSEYYVSLEEYGFAGLSDIGSMPPASN